MTEILIHEWLHMPLLVHMILLHNNTNYITHILIYLTKQLQCVLLLLHLYFGVFPNISMSLVNFHPTNIFFIDIFIGISVKSNYQYFHENRYFYPLL